MRGRERGGHMSGQRMMTMNCLSQMTWTHTITIRLSSVLFQNVTQTHMVSTHVQTSALRLPVDPALLFICPDTFTYSKLTSTLNSGSQRHLMRNIIAQPFCLQQLRNTVNYYFRYCLSAIFCLSLTTEKYPKRHIILFLNIIKYYSNIKFFLFIYL